MTPFVISVISGFSILLPTAAGVLRFKIMKRKYLPLLILLCFGSVCEAVSYWVIVGCGSNTINANIDILLDFVLTVWVFYRLHSGLSKKFLLAIVITGILLWIADNLIVNSLYSNNSMFRMVASFLIVFLSMDKITQAVLSGGLVETSPSDQAISAGFLVYYTYKAFVEAFHLFPLHPDKSFYIALWVILGFINMIVNLMFAVAILCISRKTRISIRS